MILSPEEMLPMFSPQIISISNRELSEQEYPALEPLERRSISNDQIYLLFNAMAIYIYVGRNTDLFFIYEIYKVDQIQNIDKNISEDEMFANVDESAYLKALYGIIS